MLEHYYMTYHLCRHCGLGRILTNIETGDNVCSVCLGSHREIEHLCYCAWTPPNRPNKETMCVGTDKIPEGWRLFRKVYTMKVGMITK